MRSLNTTATTTSSSSTSSHLTRKPPTKTSPASSTISSPARSDLSVSRRAKLHDPPRRTPSSATTTTTVRLNPRITAATTASTARRQQTLSPGSRTPLRTRDHNALSSHPPKHMPIIAKSRHGDMPLPHDHHNKGASAAGTPRQSLLNASAAKVVGRAPLTPKIAAAKPYHHQQQQQAVVTPLVARSRKPDQPPTTTTSSTSASRDDVTSPVSAFLTSNNITPRSGHRQNRVDSASSTPTGTPNNDRLTGDWDSARSPHEPIDLSRRHVVTFSPPSEVGSRHESSDAKFFYASEARPSQIAQPKLPAQPPNKQPTFMYANGSAVDRTRPTSPGITSQGFTPMLAPTQEAQPSKFFYANGIPDLQPSFRPTSSSGSAVSSSSKMTVPRSQTSTPNVGFVLAHPSSPTKPQHLTLATAPKGPTFAPQPLARAQTSSPQQFVPLAPAKRRVSLEANPPPSTHSRNGSISSGDAMIMSKFMASQASHTSSEASSPAILPQNPAMNLASIIQAADDFDDTQSIESEEEHNELQSPTKSSAGDPLNDLVANARRERKVQDLEIRNTSLEAINRSLERQLRKQTAELRRYRRLSRSGRLSLASMSSSRIASDSTVGTTMTIEGLSDLSEEDGEGDEDEEEDEDDSLYDTDPSDNGSVTSPGLKAAGRRRKRDEKRLQLDLSKHRELLVDSQKINQSIKRCLDWSEELIKEGKKALEYNVRVSDVELAPRVLAPRYEDDEDDTTQDLSRLGTEAGDDPETAPSTPQTTNPAGHGLAVDGAPASALAAPTLIKGPRLAPPWAANDPQNRDSGVELPVDSG
ncbi:hypothetical protein F5X68DRAFT_60283 [Plectosphaerella plurivora]|uniref:Uncharacterized protein n=1 Tax=Plectosphaerella plurivora TaxID=936078 RepID=A0A9P9ABG0_9PEZI|nr:hypothetical protein F5X68DRAFT_60283 [Plectosphaerella plurivora]